MKQTRNHSLLNKKGFTLVELLAIIVILAIILLIASVVIPNVIGTVRKRTCFINSKMMEKAAINYVVMEGISIPTGGNLKIELEEIYNKGYIKKVVDPTNLTTMCEGYVIISSDGNYYDTEGHLVCPTYCNCGEYEEVDKGLNSKIDEESVKKGDGKYFEGENPNNWVLLGRFDQSSPYGILWRIVKTNDNGRKLVFEGIENGGSMPLENGRVSLQSTAGIPFDINGSNLYEGSSLYKKLKTWLEYIHILNKEEFMKPLKWKIGGIPFDDPTHLDTFVEYEGKTTTTEAGTFNGLSSPSSIGMLNPSEFMLTSSNAGCVTSHQQGGLYNPCVYTETELNNFLYKEKYHYWTLNPRNDVNNYVWYVNNVGHLSTSMVNIPAISARPVINIDETKPILSGTGTLEDPYILEDYMINILNGPLITLIGDEEIVIREGDEYVELGATAHDPEDGDLTDEIIITGNVNVDVPGTYQVEYNVSDSDDNEAPTVFRTVIVSEIELPIITLKGSNPHKILLYEDYIEAGATAEDPFYGDISEDIVITGEVNTSELGIYIINYNVTNQDGKEAIPVKRKVIVEPSRPEIKLIGDATIELFIDEEYEELGATATDEIDGDLTDDIEILGNVNIEKEGTYTLTYKVTNSLGISASVKRKVKIEKAKPKIILKGSKTVKLFLGESYIEPGYTATDPKDGDLTDQVSVESNININKEGTYKVNYSVTNSAGVEAEAIRSVVVYIPKPEITILGKNPYKHRVLLTYEDFGATATDEMDGDLTDEIIVTSNVNVEKLGNYKVAYSVTNSNGKTADATRNVQVYAEKPEIELNGEKYIKLYYKGTYEELGARATDEIDGDITDRIVITGSVNTNKVGSYTITYKVENTFGVSVSVKRLVKVVDPKVTINLLGDNPYELLVGGFYEEPGYTAEHELLGDVTDQVTITSDLNTNQVGTYTITYKYIDELLEKAVQKTRKVKVKEIDGPIIKFTPDTTTQYARSRIINIEVLKTEKEMDESSFNYIWRDSSAKPSESEINIPFLNNTDVNTPEGVSGKYYLWAVAKDVNGNTTIKSAVYYLDNIKPVIELVDEEIVEIPLNSVYTELGATVIEDHSGLNEDGLVISSNVNPNILGMYYVTYDATDKVGLQAETVTRTVKVVELSLIDAVEVSEYFVGTDPNNWIEFGNKNASGGTKSILWRIIKFNEEGIKIIYEGTENNGNSPLENGKIATMSFDDNGAGYDVSTVKSYLGNWYNNLSEPKKTTLIQPINWCIGYIKTPYNASSLYNDNCNYKTSSPVSIGLVNAIDYVLTSKETCDAINQSSCGTSNYLKKEYDYMTINSLNEQVDSIFNVSGNGELNISLKSKTQGVRPVLNLKSNVLIISGEGTIESPYKLNSQLAQNDKTPPVVNFVYNTNNLEYKQSHNVTVSVTDNKSGVDTNTLKYVWLSTTEQPNEVAINNSFVNGESITSPSGVSGDYYLWILAKDRVGNTTIEKSDVFKIDNENPEIILNGSNPLNVGLGEEFTDPGATANDNHSGISGNITVTGSVNINVVGTYGITYSVSDKAGNIATLTRTVNVIDNTAPPVITGTYTDTRDGYAYQTVQIGDQIWFAEDLKYTGNGCLGKDWGTNTTDACRTHTKSDCSGTGSNYYCTFPKTEVLYQWGAASCPSGWHIPTDEEWTTLTNFVGENVGNKLKSSNYWNGVDSVGFNALPVGYRSKNDVLNYVGTLGYWWSSSVSDSYAWYRYLHSSSDDIDRNENSQSYGFAVRCVLDDDYIMDDRDGQVYKTVQIGDQTWFAENLRYTGNGCTGKTWSSSTTDACKINGGSGWAKDEVLYQWGAAMDGSTIAGTQGLCPSGWHIPMDEEWMILEEYVETSSGVDWYATGSRGTDAGKNLKSSSGWNGVDSVGFNALPAGYRLTDGALSLVGTYGDWLSSSVSGSKGWRRYLHSSYNSISRDNSSSQSHGYSVRCVLDDDYIIDNRDGQVYKTVQIGDQVWFAENLRYIGNGCTGKTWSSSTTDACKINGGSGWDKDEVLYQLGAASCPSGWHIPTDEEWMVLEEYVETSSGVNWNAFNWRGTDAGKNLKGTNPSWGGANSVGFNASPVGYRSAGGSLLNVGTYGRWWSSSVSGFIAWRRGLYSSNGGIHRNEDSQSYGLAVRCLWGLTP